MCQNLIEKPLYVSEHDKSITSLCAVVPQKTTLFFSRGCGHLQTEPFKNLERYYDKDYKLLMRSEDEDQLYKYADGKKIFRFDHQAATLLQNVEIPKGAAVLDYGCSKAATLKRLVERRPDIVPCAFDITDRYLPFWERFVDKNNWSLYDVKSSWRSRFDLVTAFFVLEHVAGPRKIVREISSLLKPGGIFYAIVPDTYANPADFLVADHINHFSPPSLRLLLAGEGFLVERIDDSLHDSAFVAVARKSTELQAPPVGIEGGDYLARAVEIASFWRASAQNVQKFEAEHPASNTAIYGAGFYGTFIAASLHDFEKVSCFVDQNSYLHGTTHLGKPVFSPEEAPRDIDAIFVGLNPDYARGEIEKIDNWRKREYRYFFL